MHELDGLIAESEATDHSRPSIHLPTNSSFSTESRYVIADHKIREASVSMDGSWDLWWRRRTGFRLVSISSLPSPYIKQSPSILLKNVLRITEAHRSAFAFPFLLIGTVDSFLFWSTLPRLATIINPIHRDTPIWKPAEL